MAASAPKHPGNALQRHPACAGRESIVSAFVSRSVSAFASTLVAVAVVVAVVLAAAQPAQARRLPGDQVAEHLVSVALREWREWGRTLVDTTDGRSRIERQGASETDTHWIAADEPNRRPFDARARVQHYWSEVSEPSSAGGPLQAGHARPWSAAFVSWLMREVGLSAPAFIVDAAHAEYLRALHARQDDDDSQFTLLLAEEEPLRVGDLVCAPRNISRQPDRVTLMRMHDLEDLRHLTSSHCDLVVELRPRVREARAIGGNVADSVAMTRLPLTADGRAIQTLSRPWFLIVRANRSAD